jgi:hypothetical protein
MIERRIRKFFPHFVEIIPIEGFVFPVLPVGAKLSSVIYYIKNQQDATLAILFISNCKITLHVSDAFCVHHQEY